MFWSKNRERPSLCLAVNNEFICNVQFKQSSNAPLLDYRAGVKSFELPREYLDGRRLILVSLILCPICNLHNNLRRIKQ